MDGLWRAHFQHPDDDSGSFQYLISGQLARTGDMAVAMAQEQHTRRISQMGDPEWGRSFKLVELTFMPAMLSLVPAVAWVALRKSDLLADDGETLADEHAGQTDEGAWREEVGDLYVQLHERVIGFGESLADVTTGLDPSVTSWAVEPNTDRFGRVDWHMVQQEINQNGVSWVWQTPYGLVWIDQG
ncbi:hypothetical protein AB0G73_14170 [Streptomyces sp. NPDC020719]|uniref:hypothetical protein n=1 Tax=Streptomyces sp. NPDC020719 TaxID=3154896 RepID=UPI0033CA948B